MRILVFSHYYPPEGNAPAARMSAMCSRWASMGHSVEVITCAPNVPSGIVYAGYANRLVQSETLEGVRVTRVWTHLAANKGSAGRILNFLSYMFAAVFFAWFRKRPDLVVATSPQFFCGWAGLVFARLRIRRIPFVLEIRDLWPDSIVAVGAMKNRRLLGFLYRMERWLYAGADHIVTVGEGYWEDLVNKGVPRHKLSIIPNGVDRAIFWPRSATGFFEQFGIKNRFTCAYVGTIGMAAGLEIVVRAAERLRDLGRRDIAFVLVGDGAEREMLEKMARERGLDNLVFTGRLPRETMPEVLAATDACLVHLRKAELFERVTPSKIFEMAAMEKPIILGVRGHAARLLRAAHAGVCIEPENADELADAVCSLAADPARCREYGRSGRNYVVQNYDRGVLAEKYARILNRISRGPQPYPSEEVLLPMPGTAAQPAGVTPNKPRQDGLEKAA